jgi:hypothetical protein
MSPDLSSNPVLSEGFAERVLARADLVISQRRRVRRVMGGIAAAAFVSVAVVSWIATPGLMQSPAAHPKSGVVALGGSAEEAQADGTDALSDLFPDAAPVARFATEYSDATDDEDTALFSDQDPTS